VGPVKKVAIASMQFQNTAFAMVLDGEGRAYLQKHPSLLDQGQAQLYNPFSQVRFQVKNVPLLVT
jgi:hypothetical protein